MTSQPLPQAEVIIAVHDPRRKVTRAARSVFEGAKQAVLVTVVCHGRQREEFPDLLELAAERPNEVRLLEFADGIPSPAGPFEHGLQNAVAPYVAIMGSDDFLEPGTIDAWVETAERDKADFVFAGILHQNGTNVVNPRVRPWREHGLNSIKDRLFERSAPLGLMRTEVLRQHNIRLAQGLVSGEDIEFTAHLITVSRALSTARKLPKYVIGDDAEERVTARHYTAEEMLAPLWSIIGSSWFPKLPLPERTSLVTARLRITVLATVASRITPEQWPETDIQATRKIFQWVMNTNPRALKPLPRSNRDFIDVLTREHCTPDDAATAARALATAGRVDTIMPRSFVYALHRDATIVRYIGYALNRVGA